MKTPITVLLVYYHEMVRAGLSCLLEREGIKVVGQTGDSLEAIRMASKLRLDVIVMDLAPGLNGIKTIRKILCDKPESRVLCLTGSSDFSDIESLRGVPIFGYIQKKSSSDDLVKAVRAVALGDMFFPPLALKLFLHQSIAGRLALLTERQEQVLCRISRGLGSKEIASELGISLSTLEYHRARLLRNLKALGIHSDIASLTRYALTHGHG